jgi:hypothetical protein
MESAADFQATQTVIPRVSIHAPTPDQLSLTLISNRREAALRDVQRLADGFIERTQTLAETRRTTPTQAEKTLGDYISALQARLMETRDQVGNAIAALPETNPSKTLNELLNRWTTLRESFDDARQQLQQASDDLTALETAPEPAHGVVADDERQQAYAADKALQQDLQELGVNLTELKLHLLTVWQRSSGALERLQLASEDLAAIASGDSRKPPSIDAGRDTTVAVETAGNDYVETVGTFFQVWKREFATLRQLEPDALSGEVLDLYYRLQRLLGDFLFHAGKRLSALRVAVNRLNTDPRDDARRHVFQSDLIRAFHTLQAAHHRFEFAVEAIETAQNFRLDAALRAARGLRRRSQDRIRRIEHRLQAEALKRAKMQRVDQLATAKALVRRVRQATDQTVDELVALQDNVNLTAKGSETFLLALMKAETATARLDATAADLETAQERLSELAAKRKADAAGIEVVLTACGLLESRPEIGRRLSVAAPGAGFTLLAVWAVQWWIARNAGRRHDRQRRATK